MPPPPTPIRLQAALDSAAERLHATLAAAIGQTLERLDTRARASGRIADRDRYNAGQFELRRHAAAVREAFERALVEGIAADLAPRDSGRRSLASADWQSLSLVDEREVEDGMAADRLGRQLVQDADEPLGEVERLLGALRPRGGGAADAVAADRNPLRGELLGAALQRALRGVSSEIDVRRTVTAELAAALQKALPACFEAIRDDLQRRGVQPVEPVLRGVDGPGHQLPGINSAYQTLDDLRSQSPSQSLDAVASRPSAAGFIDPEAASRLAAFLGASTSGAHGFPSSAATGGGGASAALAGERPRADAGPSSSGGDARPADARFNALLRGWTARAADLSGGSDPAHSGLGHASGGAIRTGTSPSHPDRLAAAATSTATLDGLMAVNLIHAHREELRQLAGGRLDRMVIDLIGSLFDQILSDSRVPPQMARQIARLQLPVLRVALADSTFFSSRRHPVRRFVNRIASLACAFDDFDDGPGRQFLERVEALVAEIVDGDFDQIALYATKLEALEQQTAEATQREVQQRGAVATLGAKENELRLQQRYMLLLQTTLKPFDLPGWLGDFLAQVWSQALVLAATRDGADAARLERFRRVGRELVLSIQPKGSMPLRKRFLMQLPGLMKDLNEGLAAIAWPAPAQRDFMARLQPAHAGSLNAPPLSELDHNLLSKRLEQVFATPVPGQEALTPADPVPDVAPEVLAQRFTPEEAARVGLVTEAAVDWSGRVDIDLELGEAGVATGGTTAAAAAAARPVDPSDPSGAATEPAGLDIDLDAPAGVVPAAPAAPAAAVSPARPAPLGIDHLRLGFAYRMLLQDAWQKVRLAHVSAGRGFFVFTCGRRHQQTISMTARMLARMCESGRFRAVENQYLVDRATQRARQQLAALTPEAARRAVAGSGARG